MRAFLARLPDRLLTLGATVGAVMLLVTALGVALGVRPVFLRSGSMSPALPTGTLALVRTAEASALRVGDVVCVRAQGGSRVTHRIVGLRREGDVAVLTLRGDANRTADAQTYRVRTAHRVVGHVRWLGYLVGAATGQLGIFVLGSFVTAMVLLIVRGGSGTPRAPRAPRGGGRHGRRRRAARSAAVVGAVAVGMLGPGQAPSASAAAWTDPVTISGTTLSAGVIAAPSTFTCGALGLLSVTFNWAAVAGATNYTVHYGSGGSSTTTVAGTTTTLVSAISGGTAWVVANRAVGTTTWSSAASTTRTYTVAVVSLCS